MPGAGAGKRRSAPGVATSNTNSMGRGGGTANETQPPTSSPTISAASAVAPPAVSAANVAATLNQPAAPSTATQQLSTGAAGTTSPPGVTPSSVSPSRSLHSSHSPSHHRSSTRHRLLQVRFASGMEGLQRSPDPDCRPRSRNRSRVPVSAHQRGRAFASANGSGDQDSSATRMPRLLPKRLAELSGNKAGTGIKKMGSKVIRSGWPKRKHPLPVSPLASPPSTRGTAVSTAMAYGETRMTDTKPSTPPPTITFTTVPTATVSSRPHTPNRTPTRSVSRSSRQSPTRSPPHIFLPRTLTHPISRNTARVTQPQSPFIPSVPPKISTNSLSKSLPLNPNKTPSKTSSVSSTKAPLSTFPRATPSPPSKATSNNTPTYPNSLSRAFTRARFSHVPRIPFRESKFMDPNTNGSLGDPSTSIPSGPSSIAVTCPLSDPLSSPSNTPTINSSRAPTTNVANTQTSSTSATYVTPSSPPFRGLRAFLNERKMKNTSPHIPKSSGAVTDLGSVSELLTSTPIDASALSRIYGTSPNSVSSTVLTPAALPLVRACFRMLQRSSGNELKSSSPSSKFSSATDGDISEMSIFKPSAAFKSKDQCEKKKFDAMASLNSKPKDRLEKTPQKSPDFSLDKNIAKGSINPLIEDSLDCKTLSSNTTLRPAKRKSSREAATSTGNIFERKNYINSAVGLTKQSTTTVDSITSKKSTASQTVSVRIYSKSKSPLRVAKVKTPTKQQQKVAHIRSFLSSRTTSSRSPPRTSNANSSVDRKYLRSKICSRHRALSKLSLHNSRKKIVKRKQSPVFQKPTSKASIRSKSTQTRAYSGKEDTSTTNTAVPNEFFENCPLKDFDFKLSGLPVLLWPSPVESKHSNQEGSGDVLSKTEAQLVHERMVMVPAHRVEQALGLLQRQQRLLQSVLRTTPEGPPASRGGDHHRREKWGTMTPKGSKSPTAKRKTGSSSATDVRRTRKRSRKNKKRKTVQGVEA